LKPNFFSIGFFTSGKLYKIDFKSKQEKTQHDELVSLSRQLTGLYENFVSLLEGSSKWNSIKSEIEKTDKKIDEEVYKLYGLTPEEIKIVENSTS